MAELRPDCCERPHYDVRLCDDDGIVRQGLMHHGDDYPCTGHAHFVGDHYICTSPAHQPEEAAPGRFCDASAGYGDHVCCLPPGHDGWHESRLWRSDAGSLWARWDDALGDSEPYACSHEAMDGFGDPGEWRCTRCGVTLREIADPAGPVTLSTFVDGQMISRRVRYEEVTSG